MTLPIAIYVKIVISSKKIKNLTFSLRSYDFYYSGDSGMQRTSKEKIKYLQE